MAVDTTEPRYWLNWRFLICALYLLGTMTFAAFLIWKHEGAKRLNNEGSERQRVPPGILYENEVWRTCLKGLHPVWLLLFRIFAFILLLGFLIGNAIVDGPAIFYFYTQWTFTLTTIYFGFASTLSLYGLWHDHFKGASQSDDVEQGSRVAPRRGGSINYVFQAMYQVTAGAVLLTDVVFWLIIYALLTVKDHKMPFFDVGMHSINVLILGDTILNGMWFPMFRIGYFILWTSVFVICQWIIHACISLQWPYPFMELSTPYAPLWYAAVGLLHIPCFGVFVLLVKLKHLWLSRSFPESYQGMR